MKKLRLIKPWGLRAVRQRLNDELTIIPDVADMRIACQGPAGHEDDQWMAGEAPEVAERWADAPVCARFSAQAPDAEVAFAPLAEHNGHEDYMAFMIACRN
jgi:hypothetical protein